MLLCCYYYQEEESSGLAAAVPLLCGVLMTLFICSAFPSLCNARFLCLVAPNQISFLDKVLPVCYYFAVNLMLCSLESLDTFYTFHVSVVVISKLSI